jgi:hypothetical protein
VVNDLPRVLRRHGMGWGELARGTLVPPGYLLRLRAATANPRLALAERVAAVLGVPVEAIWRLAPRRPRR